MTSERPTTYFKKYFNCGENTFDVLKRNCSNCNYRSPYSNRKPRQKGRPIDVSKVLSFIRRKKEDKKD